MGCAWSVAYKVEGTLLGIDGTLAFRGEIQKDRIIGTYFDGSKERSFKAKRTTKGKKVVDEYEEFTARPDIDGKMKDVEEGVPDEVVREGSIGKEQLEEEIVEQIARDKKASGGLAYMLGE